MKIKNRLNLALLSIFAMIVVAIVLAAGKGGPTAGVAEASAPNNLPSVANSPLTARAGAPGAPNADWSVPVPVLFAQGYDNRGFIAASPVNGAVTLIWGAAPNPDDGLVVQGSNTTLNGPFAAQ